MSDEESKPSQIVGLPPGWTKEEVRRTNGLSAGKIDTYYYSPAGKKFRSKPELLRELGSGYDLSGFDYASGKVRDSGTVPRKTYKRLKVSEYDFTSGLHHDLVLPIRQTASIFNQPVTVVRTRPESKTNSDLEYGLQEQRVQRFWERRMQSLHARNISCDVLQTLDIAKHIPARKGGDISVENILESIEAALRTEHLL